MLPNVGAPELLIIFFIALIVVGPRKLPELGRAIGRGLNEFRKIQDEVRDMVKFDLGDDIDPAPSSSAKALPAQIETGSVPQADEPDDVHSIDLARPSDMTHSERVVSLAAQEPQPVPPPPSETPVPEVASTEEEPSPWIYDVMDDDEQDAPRPPNPPVPSAE